MSNDLVVPENKPLIYPIMIPHMNWDTLNREVKYITGDSLARNLDAHEIKLRQDQSIIAALLEFQEGAAIDPYKEVREAEIVLKHLSFSFLVVYLPEVAFHLAFATDLSIITHYRMSETCWVMGGNLLQWKQAVISMSRPSVPVKVRYFMNLMLVLFQCNGFSQVWEGYSKEYLPDRTFWLKPKS